MLFIKQHKYALRAVGFYLLPVLLFFISAFSVDLLIEIYGRGKFNKYVYNMVIIVPVILIFISLIRGTFDAFISKNKESNWIGIVLMIIGLLILLTYFAWVLIILPWFIWV
jgi:hypothetical protein